MIELLLSNLLRMALYYEMIGYRMHWKKILLFFVLFIESLAIAAGKDRRVAPVASAVREIGIVPTIIIDAGHGGQNLGAHIQNPFCEEKRMTLLTARYLKKYLNQLGYRVIMTRSTDVFVSLQKRVEVANHSKGDLFISVHFNSSRSPLPQGVEVFFSDTKDDPARAHSSHQLASSILPRIIRRTQASSRGVKKAEFFVTRETKMPSVLVEGGFLSNSHERTCLKDPQYLEKIARGIVEGVDYYFKKFHSLTKI